MIKKLQEQRTELNASVKQRQLNRAAKLTEMAERNAPDGKLVVGMKVKVARESPNRIGPKQRKKLEAPVREDEGTITEINLNAGRRYTVTFQNGDTVHVGRRWLKVLEAPPNVQAEANLQLTPTSPHDAPHTISPTATSFEFGSYYYYSSIGI